MPEKTTQQNSEKTRTQRIEDFLLNPEKVVFESLEEFSAASKALLDIFSKVDINSLEKIEGEDGVTPKRGEDYMTPEDLNALEAFILSKIPKVGEDIPSVLQVQEYIKARVAEIKTIKGDKGDALKFSQLSEEEKDELRGEDGSKISPEEIITKIRTLGKNQGLRIKDIRGLENILRTLVSSSEEFEDLKEKLKNQYVVLSSPNGQSSGGESSTSIEGLIEAGDNVSLTGSGTLIDPYIISLDAPEGGVISIVAGTGIHVDNTDPANPIVSIDSATLAAITDSFKKSTDDTDDITVGSTNKFATAAEKTKLGFITVTQAVDLDSIETQAAAGAAAKVKTDFISVTQAVDLDAIEIQAAAGAAAKVKTDFLTVTQAVDLDDIESRVNNLDAAVVLKGSWDASAGTFPGGGTAQAGASYIVSVAGTVNSVSFAVGDRIIAILDNASTTTFASNWFKADYTDQVLSVAGKTGAVTLDAADIAETAGLKILTAAERTKLSNTSNTNTGDETVTTSGALINGATAKTTPVDADYIGLMDSAASNVLKKLSWLNVKATLKTYFDTLYQVLNSNLTTIAGLTATTNNFIVSVGSAWASRTPAQVKTTLSLDLVDNTSDATKNAASVAMTNHDLKSATNTIEEITTTASSATPTPTGGSLRNFFTVTALAATAAFAAPSGTPANGNRLLIRVKDNGTARALSFNAIYRAIGITLPTTTVISKTLYLGCVYNSADSKWDVTAYGIEA